MKQLLIALLFIVVIITMYTTIFKGNEGIEKQLMESGSKMNHSIERINVYGVDHTL